MFMSLFDFGMDIMFSSFHVGGVICDLMRCCT